jgi:hypothetical protein
MQTTKLARKQIKHNAQQVKSRQEHSHMNIFNYYYFKTNTINGIFSLRFEKQPARIPPNPGKNGYSLAKSMFSGFTVLR